MKKSNILPFGDWFKVYESADRNFKKSQVLLESRIFENKGGVDLPLPGKDLNTSFWTQLAAIKFRKDYTTILSAINANKSNQSVQASLDEMKKLRATDRTLFSSYVAGVATPETMLALVTTAIMHDLNAKGPKWMIKYRLLAGPIEVKRKPDGDIKLTPKPEGGIYTIGRVASGSATSISSEGKDTVSGYQNLKKYINNFNLAQFAAQGDDEYDNESVGENGFFDFGVANGNPRNQLAIYADSTYEGGSVERSEEEEVDVVGAETAQVGQADIKFQQATLEKGGATILPSEAPKIEALAKTIQEKFAGKTINNFELLSSASPEYGTIKNAQGWESNYSKTTGVGDPGAGTDDATNNVKLAYERGVSFMKALNAKLNEMGHPGFATYQIKWQIAAQGGPANDGRFVDLQISTNEKKGTVVKKTDVTGKPLEAAKTTSGASEATLYRYEIEF